MLLQLHSSLCRSRRLYCSPWPSTVSLESASTLPHLSGPRPPLPCERAKFLLAKHRFEKIQEHPNFPHRRQFTSVLPTPRRAQFRLCVPTSAPPLFLFPDGSRLTAKLVTTMLKRLLQDADLNPSRHSLRIGCNICCRFGATRSPHPKARSMVQ